MPAPKDMYSDMLAESAYQGDLAGVKRALENKPDFEYRGIAGTALQGAILKQSAEIVRLLIDSGAPVGASSNKLEKRSPLHYAAEVGNPEIVGLLLQKKAPIDAGNDDEQTPLMLAARTCNLPAVKLLLDAGAQLEARARSGETPLFFAIGANKIECVQELLRRGAGLTGVANRIGATQGSYSEGDFTPLGGAAFMDHLGVMKALLAKGADPNLATPKGTTPLLVAAEHGKAETISALLAAKADPNRASKDHVTPLLLAARRSNFAVAKVLLAAGADPTILVNGRERALEYLLYAGDGSGPALASSPELAKYLNQKGNPKKPLPPMPAGRAELGELCKQDRDCNAKKGLVCAPDANIKKPYAGSCQTSELNRIR